MLTFDGTDIRGEIFYRFMLQVTLFKYCCMLNSIALFCILCLLFLFISRVLPKSTRILEILTQDSKWCCDQNVHKDYYHSRHCDSTLNITLKLVTHDGNHKVLFEQLWK